MAAPDMAAGAPPDCDGPGPPLSRCGLVLAFAAMNRVIYNTATTLNGYLADANDSLAWLFVVDQGEIPSSDRFARFLEGIGATVQGSTTYEWVLREEKMLENPDAWRKVFGDKPAFVFTTRDLPRPEGIDVRFVRGEVAPLLPAIFEAAGGGDIWLIGGGDLAGQFDDAHALHELRLSLAPVTLTDGKPLLPRNLGADRLTLREVEQQGQFAALTYDVKPRG